MLKTYVSKQIIRSLRVVLQSLSLCLELVIEYEGGEMLMNIHIQIEACFLGIKWGVKLLQITLKCISNFDAPQSLVIGYYSDSNSPFKVFIITSKIFHMH